MIDGSFLAGPAAARTDEIRAIGIARCHMVGGTLVSDGVIFVDESFVGFQKLATVQTTVFFPVLIYS